MTSKKPDKITIFRKPVFFTPPVFKNISEIKNYFDENGFAVIPGIINSQQIKTLRDICDEYHLRKGKLEMYSSEFLSTKELAEIPFDSQVIEKMKYMLGENFTIYPNFTMRSNLYTSWHIDKAFWNNKPYLYDKSFRHIQCAIYLQNNTPENASGLDVIPGSHKNRFILGGSQSFLTRKLRYLSSTFTKPVSLKTTAGDLILFDARLIHQGSQPVSKRSDSNKYAIYWSTSINESFQVKTYMKYLFDKVNTIKHERTVQSSERFEDIRRIKYPEDYKYVIKKINQENINIPTFNNL